MDLTAYYERLSRRLLPNGRAWVGETTARLMRAFSWSLARVHAQAESVAREANPLFAVDTSNWQTATGVPGDCDATSASLIRGQILAKLNQSSSTNPADLKALAASLGFEVEIIEYRATTCNDTCNDPLNSAAWSRTWEVTYSGGEIRATCNDTCNDPLREFTAQTLICVFRKLKPLHTNLLFNLE